MKCDEAGPMSGHRRSDLFQPQRRQQAELADARIAGMPGCALGRRFHVRHGLEHDEIIGEWRWP